MLLLLLGSSRFAWSDYPDFTLHHRHGDRAGPTLLVVGGIQGDEPGGFHAAALLATQAEVTRGNLWVVPNLNFVSIVNRNRGLNGDMNRKFKSLDTKDPDYKAVRRIQELITHPEVDFIFNLHDGSGFYRPTHHDRTHNPNRWGQSVIIDQVALKGHPLGALQRYALAAIERVNGALLQTEHRFHLRNTRTAEGDREMEKSLTYYAIRHQKPAVGLEASKNLKTAQRAYYHLRALKSFAAELGVELSFPFALTVAAIDQQIEGNLRLTLSDRLQLPLTDIRSQINLLPLPLDQPLLWQTNHPLLAVVKRGKQLDINYGNRRLTSLQPQFLPYDTEAVTLTLVVDGKPQRVMLGQEVVVQQSFRVEEAPAEYRVNLIGWNQTKLESEVGVTIEHKAIDSRFSLDQAGTLFRLEVYRQHQFSGMVTVRFGQPLTVSQIPSEKPQ